MIVALEFLADFVLHAAAVAGIDQIYERKHAVVGQVDGPVSGELNAALAGIFQRPGIIEAAAVGHAGDVADQSRQRALVLAQCGFGLASLRVALDGVEAERKVQRDFVEQFDQVLVENPDFGGIHGERANHLAAPAQWERAARTQIRAARQIAPAFRAGVVQEIIVDAVHAAPDRTGYRAVQMRARAVQFEADLEQLFLVAAVRGDESPDTLIARSGDFHDAGKFEPAVIDGDAADLMEQFRRTGKQGNRLVGLAQGGV
jgi:hypothetical protein